MTDDWVDRVWRFWFEALKREDWFRKSDDVDRRISASFAEVHRAVSAGLPYVCLTGPRPALASVIVLDQFSRNMFRGTPAAFAEDAKALAVAKAAIALGFDSLVEPTQRAFFYLPFEHSEDAWAQERSIGLFRSLGDADALHWALEHKKIIDRFGRYPHRNAILGRVSTVEELEFLKEPGSSF